MVGGPGLRRVRRGRGFGYLGQDGAAVTDPATLKRIEDLVIPPAWKKVWICPHPNGHIQAVGTDVAGRRQYLYHSQWQQERGEEKFDRVLELSAGLADWRNDITGDLRRRGLTRDRVLALGLRLLDLGYFRHRPHLLAGTVFGRAKNPGQLRGPWAGLDPADPRDHGCGSGRILR